MIVSTQRVLEIQNARLRFNYVILYIPILQLIQYCSTDFNGTNLMAIYCSSLACYLVNLTK